MLKRIFLTMISLALLASMACGGDSSPSSDESAEGMALIRAAHEKMAQLDTMTIKQTSLTDYFGRVGEVTITTSVEGADKGYMIAKNSVSLQTVEMAFQGQEAFIKAGTPFWRPISFSELGIDPAAMNMQFDILETASGADLRGITEEDGVRVQHVRIEFDGAKYKDLMAQLFRDDSVIGKQLDSAKLEEFRADFYVSVEDGTLRSAVIEAKIDINGRKCRSEIMVEYLNFNQPVKFPADLPFPVS